MWNGVPWISCQLPNCLLHRLINSVPSIVLLPASISQQGLLMHCLHVFCTLPQAIGAACVYVCACVRACASGACESSCMCVRICVYVCVRACVCV